ncbi:MFS transporter [Streptomyces canus]|uniref:MFS transporter n=1 Tax=Streptomyces canus TaxID=58343 RepID=UPI002251FA51|nr:MFS transporter [Streptomyces canus]MCX4856213.1 MFS transporter [Streptomyces canus]WSW38316.1 MFS transporter [Streptomyces canus]
MMDERTTRPPQEALGSGGRGWTLAVVCVATFMLLLDLTVVNVALPDIREAFDASFTSLQWVLDAYALGLAAVLLTAGSLADRLGRKRVFNVGFVVFLLASLACGLAGDDVVLSVARGVQGLGGAVLFAVGPALIGQEFQGQDRGKAFGVFGGVVGLSIAFGPLIGGALTDGLGWRWIFLVNVPVGLIALVISLLRMREWRQESAPALDWWGLVLFSGALSLLVLALLRGESDGWGSAPIVAMALASVVLLVVFGVVEKRRGERAMLQLSLFRNVTFNGVSAVTLLCAAATMSAIFLLVSYVQNVLAFSPWETGLRFLPLTLTLFVAAAVAGSLTTRVPQRLLMGVSLALIAVGLALVALTGPDTAWTALLPSMFGIGVGMGLFNPARASLSIAVVEPSKAGMASGISETFQQVGVAIGIAGFGAVFHSRVTDLFVESDAARQLGPAAHDFGEAVAAGGGAEALRQAPRDLVPTLDEAARTAFVDGLTDVMLVCAVVAAVGALVGFAFVRNRDLHESARMETSTDTERSAATPGESDEGSENIAVPAARVAGHGQEPAGGSY